MKKRLTTAPSRSRRFQTTTEETEQCRGQIIRWLQDAYGMELGLEASLEKQKRNKDLSVSVRDRAAAHLEETRRHAEDVRRALESLNAAPSRLKTGVGIAMQASKGMATVFARDEKIKDLIDSYAMEHFEIACYTALTAAAEHAGFVQIAEICRRIIRDEERMAAALKESLAFEVTSYLFEVST